MLIGSLFRVRYIEVDKESCGRNPLREVISAIVSDPVLAAPALLTIVAAALLAAAVLAFGL